MSMSTYLELYSDDPKKKNQKMVEALNALNDAGITTLPKEMADYFKVPLDTNPNEVDPDETHILMASTSLHRSDECQGISKVDQGEEEEGFIVNLKELPKEVKFIKFWNSW